MTAMLALGQTLSFGDINLNVTGVATRRDSVPWGQIDSIEVKRGLVALNRAGKWLPLTRTRASQIPNLYLFLHVARTHQHTARP
jgi:hypothetical protein